MSQVRQNVFHMAENGDHYLGVEVTLRVGGLTFVTFSGYYVSEAEMEDGGLQAYRERVGLVGSWVYDEDANELAAQEVFT